MTEVKDPLQAIQQALNAPIEAVEPTELDVEAIGRLMAARNSKPTLKDELEKE